MASPRIGGFNVLRMEDVPTGGGPTGETNYLWQRLTTKVGVIIRESG
jgi:hypothetical protein